MVGIALSFLSSNIALIFNWRDGDEDERKLLDGRWARIGLPGFPYDSRIDFQKYNNFDIKVKLRYY